jgi:hypothetical protein
MGKKGVKFLPLHMNTTQYPFTDRISGNISRMGSIEVPINTEYPDEVIVRVG